MLLRHTLAAVALATTSIAAPGCWLEESNIPVLEHDDVRIDPPGSSGFRQLGDRGEVYDLALDVSGDVNEWVTDIAVGMSKIVHELDRYPEDRTEGSWRVYGPHDDDNGEDGSWMAKIDGDGNGAEFELYIGRRGARANQMRLLVSGDLSVVETQRAGRFTIDFDTIHEYADIIDDADPTEDFGGTISVRFERDSSTREKNVELSFDGFYFDDGVDDLDFDGERYVFDRDPQGAGQFHFATWSSFDGSDWSGPELERMVVDMRWNANEAGRARGQIIEVDGVGDLRHGDLRIDECFDDQGGLLWRDLSDAYLEYEPDYAFGNAGACVFEDADLSLGE